MKLNPECLRGILLTVEDNCTFSTSWLYQQNNFDLEHLAEYDHEEIIYHIRQASQSGLIQGVQYYDNGKCVMISDLTPSGHEFLANIRSDKLWKRLMSGFAGASLPIMIEGAKEIAMKHFLG